MRLLTAMPDLGSTRWLWGLALAVLAIGAVWLGFDNWDKMDAGYGDTDDATRLVAVRALLHGQGWWDQRVTRFQPPVGLWMHWSRLLDGGIAALDALFRLALSNDDAEFAARFTWPLLWIAPAAMASLMSARRLGLGLLANGAVIVCAVILASDVHLYVQFRPGRIDHHDVQMVCAMLALAGAMQAGVGGPLLAGGATALGAAVGLEGLVFGAAVGAALALRTAFDPRHDRAAIAYGLTLGLGTALLFAIQTPPWRWGVQACDALALNLVAGVAVAGLGLAGLARFGSSLRWPARLGVLAAIGIAAAGLYIGLYPRCLHGFFADVDPRIRPIWLNYVQEVRPIAGVTKRNLGEGVGFMAAWGFAGLAWLVLGLSRAHRQDFAWWLSGLLLALGVAAGASAIRMSGYAEWFGVPIIAAAAVEVVAWAGFRSWLPVALAGLIVSPVTISAAATQAAGTIAPLFPPKHLGVTAGKPVQARPHPKASHPKGPPPVDRCFENASFDPLANASPAGVVLGEVDLGPFVLANTDDSALAGPYHRMSWGILRAHAILKAPADGASADLARQAGVAYVLECRMHGRHGDRADMSPDALQKRLDAGRPPAWLKPLSRPDESLQVYRVLPAARAAAAPGAAGARR